MMSTAYLCLLAAANRFPRVLLLGLIAIGMGMSVSRTADAGPLILFADQFNNYSGWDGAPDDDGDGVPNGLDNAPLYANADQSDADGDGIGDVADIELNVSNAYWGHLTLGGPIHINPGDAVTVNYNVDQYAGRGIINLYLGSSSIEAIYYGGLGTEVGSFQIDASFFGGPGWDLNTPGTYVLGADAHSPGFFFDYTSTTVTVAAIPEPETYATLLAGLSLMGLMARRRKQKEAAAA